MLMLLKGGHFKYYFVATLEIRGTSHITVFTAAA